MHSVPGIAKKVLRFVGNVECIFLSFCLPTEERSTRSRYKNKR